MEHNKAKLLFTDRHGMTAPRVKEALDVQSATGLLSIMKARVEANWFFEAFSKACPDGDVDCENCQLRDALAANKVIQPWGWPKRGKWPSDPQIFDLIEFLYEHAALPSSHRSVGDEHFYDYRPAGQEKFAEDLNRIFARNGMAFELAEGKVTRIAPTGLQEALAEAVFKTGDTDLDRLLETAREKFLNKSPEVRREGLEKLWDAWERLKTVEPGKDKQAQATALLDKAAKEPVLRERLELEAKELNFIGNNLMIRHTETTKPRIEKSAQVDYLFHRLFAMLRLLLKSSGRGG